MAEPEPAGLPWVDSVGSLSALDEVDEEHPQGEAQYPAEGAEESLPDHSDLSQGGSDEAPRWPSPGGTTPPATGVHAGVRVRATAATATGFV